MAPLSDPPLQRQIFHFPRLLALMVAFNHAFRELIAPRIACFAKPRVRRLRGLVSCPTAPIYKLMVVSPFFAHESPPQTAKVGRPTLEQANELVCIPLCDKVQVPYNLLN